MLLRQGAVPKPLEAKNVYSGLYGSSLALTLAQLIEQSVNLLIVTENSLSAYQLLDEIKFFLGERNDRSPITLFPDWEILVYDRFSPHEDIISQRLKTLCKLGTEQMGGLIVPIQTLMHRLAPTTFLGAQAFSFQIGDRLDRKKLRERLIQSSYRQVSQVLTHGEYAIRGSIIDIYPMGSVLPIRLDLFDDEIDAIKTFDPDNQRSLDHLRSIELLPAREFPMTETAIERFRQNWRQQFTGNPINCPHYQAISSGNSPAGVEYYLPFFFEEMATLFDYLPPNTYVVQVGELHMQADQFVDEVKQRYEQLRHDTEYPILAPQQICLSTQELFHHFKQHTQIITHRSHNKKNHDFGYVQLPPLQIDRKKTNPLALLTQFIQDNSFKILLVADSTGRREVLTELLKQRDLMPKVIDGWNAFISTDCPLTITQGLLTKGFMSPDQKFAAITENELYAEQVRPISRKKSRSLDPDVIIRDLSELHIGQPIVHLEQGVGRYQGLECLETSGLINEYIKIAYAGEDKIYVPVTSLHLISRYTGGNPEDAPLHQLGSDKWRKEKRRAIEKIHDVAVELLDIYAQREKNKGFSFRLPSFEYQKFTAGFPFEMTPDQEKTMQQVISDMCQEKCMDRLVCGDVGFGKTEIALRASFIAASNAKQVVILTPTTLLAGQHHQTFQDRFAEFPINIELLSRFRTAKEQEITLRSLAEGKVDIVIGTHKLLQRDVKLKDLGLLIIDEEHQFGVKQKEKLKSLRTHIDILTMTATPIPRTLNLSLSGMRDISIIASPPAKRLSIKTFLIKKNKHIIREAVLREIARGGQVFYLHNQVNTIAHTAEELRSLIPEARIEVAHGQMRERELENTMRRFYHRQFNVLVCTTIIENGIDIPTANTMLIDKASNFGLAQLHQLRGRVGRSHHQAYTYLIVPDQQQLTPDAKKRLDAFTKMEDLGAGFSLAVHDLEIRGAGEILGEGQSGHIDAIGFSLYMELLDNAVKALQSGKTPALDETLRLNVEMNLQVSALIPEDYMPSINNRLIQYKRISNAKSNQALESIQVDLIDRFGLLPPQLKRLFKITELKLLADRMGIKRLDLNKNGATLEFTEKPNVDPQMIFRLIQEQGDRYQLQGPHKLKIRSVWNHDDQKLIELFKLLNMLKT